MAEASLKGKVAVVTGGSNGIGAACVRQLAEAGATVVIGYNAGADRAQALLAKLPGGGHRAIQMRMEETETLRKAAAEVKQAYGHCDIVVNSAGYTRLIPHHDFEALDDKTFDDIFIVNVRGPFALVRAFSPLMKTTGDGVIINISSVGGFKSGRAGSNIAYGSSKAALDHLTRNLAGLLGPEIRIMCVSPGAVDTDFVPGRPRSAIEKLAESSPLKKVLSPDDVAHTVMGCITHLKSSTGGIIVVDSGRHVV
jgi:3-oxoacyl-[acyl-carrier protein] reductase